MHDMTEESYIKALRTITEALDLWVKTAVTRKTQDMLLAERQHALDMVAELRSYHDHMEARRF